MSTLPKGHSPHLLAACRALLRQLEEIERVAVQGRAPGTSSQPLTPLPPELWAALLPHLNQMRAQAEAISRRHAPPEAGKAGEAQPLAATLRWTALLLSRMEDTVEDLDASATARKFGPFAEENEAAQLAEDRQAILTEWREAQTALEAWRQNQHLKNLKQSGE